MFAVVDHLKILGAPIFFHKQLLKMDSLNQVAPAHPRFASDRCRTTDCRSTLRILAGAGNDIPDTDTETRAAVSSFPDRHRKLCVRNTGIFSAADTSQADG